MSNVSNPTPQVHLLLLYRSHMPPSLVYDLSSPPSVIVSTHHWLNPNTLYKPATRPPLNRLIITHPLLREHIEVLPSQSLSVVDGPWSNTSNSGTQTRGVPYVSVLDVLETLYHNLRRPITIPQYNALSGEGLHTIVDESYFDRCSRFSDPTVARNREDRKKGRKMGQIEATNGIKHLDLLLGNRYFLGLTGTFTAPEVFELCVDQFVDDRHRWHTPA